VGDSYTAHAQVKAYTGTASFMPLKYSQPDAAMARPQATKHQVPVAPRVTLKPNSVTIVPNNSMPSPRRSRTEPVNA
jgi:hypothetical protein